MGGNRGKKITFKKNQIHELHACWKGNHQFQGEAKPCLFSVMQNMKWASLAVLHEIPNFLTLNLIISLPSNS